MIELLGLVRECPEGGRWPVSGVILNRNVLANRNDS